MPPEPDAGPEPEQQDAEVRPLPVLAEPRPVDRPREGSLPAVVAATGGFLIGVVTFVLVRLLRRPQRAASLRLGRGRGRRGKRVEVATSRSFLVDIHLLKDR
jgi:hypothetical protein